MVYRLMRFVWERVVRLQCEIIFALETMCVCSFVCLPAWHWYVCVKVYTQVLVSSLCVCESIFTMLESCLQGFTLAGLLLRSFIFQHCFLSPSLSLSQTLTGKIKFVISLLKNQLENKIKYWQLKADLYFWDGPAV